MNESNLKGKKAGGIPNIMAEVLLGLAFILTASAMGLLFLVWLQG